MRRQPGFRPSWSARSASYSGSASIAPSSRLITPVPRPVMMRSPCAGTASSPRSSALVSQRTRSSSFSRIMVPARSSRAGRRREGGRGGCVAPLRIDRREKIPFMVRHAEDAGVEVDPQVLGAAHEDEAHRPRPPHRRIHRPRRPVDQHRHTVAPGVEDRHRAMHQAHVAVQDHRQWLPRNLRIAMRNRNRMLFVQTQQHLRIFIAKVVHKAVVQTPKARPRVQCNILHSPPNLAIYPQIHRYPTPPNYPTILGAQPDTACGLSCVLTFPYEVLMQQRPILKGVRNRYLLPAERAGILHFRRSGAVQRIRNPNRNRRFPPNGSKHRRKYDPHLPMRFRANGQGSHSRWLLSSPARQCALQLRPCLRSTYCRT